MNTITKHMLLAFAGVSLFTACSRPYATYQRTAPTTYYTATTPSAPTTVAVVETPAVAPSASVVTDANPVAAPVAAEKPAVAIQAVQQQLNEAVASRKIDVTDKKVQKRMARVQELLAKAGEKSVVGSSAPARKLSLAERMMLKKMDRQIKNKLAPERTMAKSVLTIGLVIAIIGLILIVLNTATALGVIALVVGLVLIVLDLLNIV
jgi:hypothetical protein